MKDTAFAFADAEIRALEPTLLTQAQLAALIEAEDVKTVLERLASFGWSMPDGVYDAEGLLARQQEEVWSLTDRLLADLPEHDLLTCVNDYHNLKVAIKSLLLSREPSEYLSPTSLSVEGLVAVFAEKRFSDLPRPMQDTAAACYDLATRTEDGQQIDFLLDRAALEAMLSAASRCESGFCTRYATLFVDTADIKIAYRACRAGKRADLLQDALVTTENLNAPLLAKAAAMGEEELLSFLETTPLSDFVPALRESVTEFEKQCDDALIALLAETRQIAFGAEPILAYYLAKENELRNLRILLVCKGSGASAETITERMRDLYV